MERSSTITELQIIWGTSEVFVVPGSLGLCPRYCVYTLKRHIFQSVAFC